MSKIEINRKIRVRQVAILLIEKYCRHIRTYTYDSSILLFFYVLVDKYYKLGQEENPKYKQ